MEQTYGHVQTYMFDPKARGVCDADQPRQLSVLLPGHQLWQHVAHAENVSERNLQLSLWAQGNQALANLVWIPASWSEYIDSSSKMISKKQWSQFISGIGSKL